MGIVNKYDIFLIVFLLVISVCGVFVLNKTATNGDMLEIQVNGKLVKTLPLNVDDSFVIDENGIYNVITISDGIGRIEDANCHDKVCVMTKGISKNGETIVCLPNKVSLKVVGKGKEAEYDVIAK